MKIPNPKANYNDEVMVLNYRCKPPKWEKGELGTLCYKNSFGGWSWHYDVRMISKSGKVYWIYVGDKSIRRA